jgi:hypothetical protein
LQNNSTGIHYRDKTIEKTILRSLGSWTFSHSLDPKRTCNEPHPTILNSHEVFNGLNRRIPRRHTSRTFIFSLLHLA